MPLYSPTALAGQPKALAAQPNDSIATRPEKVRERGPRGHPRDEESFDSPFGEAGRVLVLLRSVGVEHIFRACHRSFAGPRCHVVARSTRDRRSCSSRFCSRPRSHRGDLPGWDGSHRRRRRAASAGKRVSAASLPDARCAVLTSWRAAVELGTTSDRRHDRAASGHPRIACVSAPRESAPSAATLAVRRRTRGISVAGLPAPSSRAPPFG